MSETGFKFQSFKFQYGRRSRNESETIEPPTHQLP